MASEILGLFTAQSPQEIRNKALDSMMISPAQMGSQGLLQQVVSMGQNAGTVLGMGAGSLLGGKVAGEVEAAYLEEAIKAGSAVKGTPAEKMKAVADALADKPGMGKQYMMAQQEVRKLELADLQKQKAQQDLIPPYKDFMVETVKYVDNGQGQIVAVKDYIKVTRKYNPVTKEYEDIKQSSEKPKTDGETTVGAASDPAAKARAERKRREEQGVYTNPALTNAPKQTKPLPPAGSGGMNYGFETGGLIQPEGY